MFAQEIPTVCLTYSSVLKILHVQNPFAMNVVAGTSRFNDFRQQLLRLQQPGSFIDLRLGYRAVQASHLRHKQNHQAPRLIDVVVALLEKISKGVKVKISSVGTKTK
jgi:hypothetical protein